MKHIINHTRCEHHHQSMQHKTLNSNTLTIHMTSLLSRLMLATVLVGAITWTYRLLRRPRVPVQRSISNAPLLSRRKTSPPSITLAPPHIHEPTSKSDFQSVVTSHVSLDLTVDFQTKTLRGQGTYSIIRRNNADVLILDVRDLLVLQCHVASSAEFVPTGFTLSEPHPIFGSALCIKLNKDTTHVRVAYETTAASSALQWLDPSQTAGKSHPYLFTQSQAIHARSFFPCQDAPGVKATYDAQIAVPSPLVALMSATSIGSSKVDATTYYRFEQQVPVPSYLVALAVGDLESRELGPRSRVWSEPSVVELAQREFVDTERFLSIAEQLCGEYVWGRYDLLLMPPSFPYGGMENPCLVFLTPTLLAGDKSLVNVVAHEIAHSWFGNLVTNATWSDFWMNEGFTVFAERRIIAKLYGETRAGLKAELGKRHLQEDIERYGGTHPFTKLHIDMKEADVDPDDSFSSVPYEKGCAFLEHLERLVGGPAVFEPFLKEYVGKFRFGFVDCESFKIFFTEKFPNENVAWETWLHAPGMPPIAANVVLEENVLVKQAEVVAVSWAKTGKKPEQARGANTSWSCDQIVVFLEKLLEIQTSEPNTITLDTVHDLDEFFAFSNSRNAEVRFKWNSLCLRLNPNAPEACLEDTVEFLIEQGRMKFVRPLYRDLLKANRELAIDTFKKHRTSYHAIAQKMVARDLGL